MKAPDEIKQLFQKVFIHSEADLPKEEGTYFCYHKTGRMSAETFRFDTYDTAWISWWLVNIESYFQPVKIPESWESDFIKWDNDGHSNASQRDIINWFKDHFQPIEQPAEKATYTLNCNKCGVPCDFNEAFPKDQLCTNCFIEKYGNYSANPAVPKCEFNSYEKGMEPTQREVTLVCNNWMPDKGTSATRCANCGKDRWQHKL